MSKSLVIVESPAKVKTIKKDVYKRQVRHHPVPPHMRSAVSLLRFLYGIRTTVSSVTSAHMYVLTLLSVRLP